MDKFGGQFKIGNLCLSTVFDGCCRWKLSSGNLHTFIRPNQEQKREMQL